MPLAPLDANFSLRRAASSSPDLPLLYTLPYTPGPGFEKTPSENSLYEIAPLLSESYMLNSISKS